MSPLSILLLIIVLQVILLVGVIILNLSLLSFALSWLLDVPFVATPTRYSVAIGDELAITDRDVIYDLGCGDGRVLIALARRYPRARFVGIERNTLLVATAQMRAFFARTKNVAFRKENVLTARIDDATKLYLYLSNSFIEKLRPHFESAPQLTRIVSRAYTIPSLTPQKSIAIDTPRSCNKHMLYVYELR